MAKLTPAEFAEKQARRLKASVEDIRRGIDRVTINPCEQAAAKKDKMLTNLTAAVSGGRWEQGLKRVSLDDWKRKARDVGVNRIAGGIDAARTKVEDFASELLPHIDRVKSQVDAMPDVTLDDNIGRMAAFARGMANFKRSK